MTRGRAYRRDKIARLKKRARHIRQPLNAYYRYVPWDDPAVIGIIATTPKTCSCYLCGNERHHFGVLPAQWRRQIQTED